MSKTVSATRVENKPGLQDSMLSNLRRGVWHLHIEGSQRLLRGRGATSSDRDLNYQVPDTQVLHSPRRHGRVSHRDAVNGDAAAQDVDAVGKVLTLSTPTGSLTLPELSPGPVSLIGPHRGRQVLPPSDDAANNSQHSSSDGRRTMRMRSTAETEDEFGDFAEQRDLYLARGRRFSRYSDSDSVSTTRKTKQRRRRKPRPGAKFRRLASFLTVLFGLWQQHARRVKHFLDTNIDLLEVEEPHDLLFDVTEFRAGKQARVSQDTIRILKKPPSERTTDEVKYIQIAFGNYQALTEYPIPMQKIMAQKCWYESYDPKRVIIRQGHVAQCFYFILSGSVIVSKMDASTGISQTVCFLGRNESFGELGIMSATMRRATVISKDPVELLVFGNEDYVDIFMAGGLGNPNDTFPRELFYFRGWPTELLAQNPSNALLSYFKRGTVLIRDSRYSDWLFIVKTGSCLVLKKLVKVQPTETPDSGHLDDDEYRTSSPLMHGAHTEFLDTRVEEADLRAARQLKLRFREQLLHDMGLGVQLCPLQEDPSLQDLDGDGDGGSTSGRGSTDITTASESSRSNSTLRRPPEYLLASTGPFLSRTDIPNHRPTSGDGQNEVQGGDTEPNSQHKTNSIKARLEKLRKKRLQKMEKATLVDELNERYTAAKASKAIPPSEADSNPEFVRVKTLIRGDVFGMTDVVHDDQPSFSLVSNGAECVIVKKQFYLEHVSPRLMITLRSEVSPYPTDAELQVALQTHLDWVKEKKRVLKKAMLRNRLSKTDIHDARSSLLHEMADDVSG